MALVIILCVQVAVLGTLWLVRYYTWVKPEKAALAQQYPVETYRSYLNALNQFISDGFPTDRSDLEVNGSATLSNDLMVASKKVADDMLKTTPMSLRQTNLLGQLWVEQYPDFGHPEIALEVLHDQDLGLYYRIVSPPVFQARDNIVNMLPSMQDRLSTESAKVVPQTLEPLLLIVPLPLFLLTFFMLYFIVRNRDDEGRKESGRPPDNSSARWLIGTMVVLLVEIVVFAAVFLGFYAIRMAPKFAAASRTFTPAVDELSARYKVESDPLRFLLNPQERTAELAVLRVELDQKRNEYEKVRLQVWLQYNIPILVTFLAVGLLAVVLTIIFMRKWGMTGRRPPREVKLGGTPKPPKPPKGNWTWIPPGADD